EAHTLIAPPANFEIGLDELHETGKARAFAGRGQQVVQVHLPAALAPERIKALGLVAEPLPGGSSQMSKIGWGRHDAPLRWSLSRWPNPLADAGGNPSAVGGLTLHSRAQSQQLARIIQPGKIGIIAQVEWPCCPQALLASPIWVYAYYCRIL